MDTKKRTIIRIIAFFLVAILITWRVYSVIRWKESTGVLRFYEYENDQADVIFYGASRTACAINPSTMWDEYGIAAIDLVEGGQNLGSTYYYMQESLKTQHPMLMVVDLALLESVDDGHDGNMYINTINMKYSLIYFKNAIYEWSHSVFSDSRNMLKWLFAKFPVFHSRYREITYKDYEPMSNELPAHYTSYSAGAYEIPAACTLTDTHELSGEVTGYLDAMIALAGENNAQILFYVPPYCVEQYYMEGYNAAQEYLGAKGYEMINLCARYQDIGFDYSTDMVDEGLLGSHVNANGSVKVTGFMTDYLHDHYDIPDRRGDLHYAVYDRISETSHMYDLSQEIKSKSDTVSEMLGLVDTNLFDVAVVTGGERADMMDAMVISGLGGNEAYRVGEHSFCTSGDERDYRYHIGRDVTLDAASAMIYIKDTSRTSYEQDAEIVIVEKKTGNICIHNGYHIDEAGNVSLAWWGT